MSSFVEISDELVAAGLSRCSPAFRAAQRQFILSCQRADGAFCSPGGDADLYYTEFAMRSLVLLAPPHEPLRRAGDWLARLSCPDDEISAFSYLNARRLLAAKGVADLPQPPHLPPLNDQSAYRLFLGLLCRELMGQGFPAGIAEAILRLAREDGGFAESPSYAVSQTNATAAGLAALLLAGNVDCSHVPKAIDYLLARQCPDGGIAAHAGIGSADLLSTFTAMLSLVMLGRIPSPGSDLVGIARFVRACARSPGGFAAAPAASLGSDVEYTYYGIGLTGLLRAALEAQAAS